MMDTQPRACFDSACPLAGVAKGFVLGVGDPKRAKYAFMFETPAAQEIVFQIRPQEGRGYLETQAECEEEIARRREAYPGMEDRFLRTGVPVVGKTGMAVEWWIWKKAGIRREDAFIDNTLRCFPLKNKAGQAYPTGATRKEAERCCRQYDRIHEFRPTCLVTTIHPAAVLREITPLPLVVRDMERVRDFTAQGQRVMCLLGGKASFAFQRFASNVTRWRGFYQLIPPTWVETYKSLFEFKGKAKKTKELATRPETLDVEACKKSKRYKGRGVPKCTCAPCWERYYEFHKEESNGTDR